MANKQLAEGFTCECGTTHKYPPYVYAHWYEALTHTCTNCGRKHDILQGKAKLSGSVDSEDEENL